MLFVSPPEVVVHLVAPFMCLFRCQFVVTSAFSMKNHSWNLGVLMPEDRLYFKQRNKAEKVSAERICKKKIVSSLNSVSSRRVQHISYICVFLTHKIRFLPREKGPQDVFLQIYPISSVCTFHFAGLVHNVTHTHTYIYIFAYNGRITWYINA